MREDKVNNLPLGKMKAGLPLPTRERADIDTHCITCGGVESVLCLAIRKLGQCQQTMFDFRRQDLMGDLGDQTQDLRCNLINQYIRNPELQKELGIPKEVYGHCYILVDRIIKEKGHLGKYGNHKSIAAAVIYICSILAPIKLGQPIARRTQKEIGGVIGVTPSTIGKVYKKLLKEPGIIDEYERGSRFG